MSPLTRALQTASLAFPTYDGRIEVEPLARERVWLSSDCGRSPDELKADFPDGRWVSKQVSTLNDEPACEPSAVCRLGKLRSSKLDGSRPVAPRRYTFDHLPSIWWYNGDSSDPKRVILEPERE